MTQTVVKDRRTFLKHALASGGALAWGGFTGALSAAAPTDWKSLIGIQLTVVQDELVKDIDGALAKLAAIGYKVVNPIGLSGLDAKAYRAMLDRHGMIAPQIDQGFSTGADMEKDLEGLRLLGIKFAEPAPAGRGPAGAARGGAAGANAGGANPAAAGGRAAGGGGGRGAGAIPTVEAAKRNAETFNGYGKAATKFGMKVIYHFHPQHFATAEGDQSTFFDTFIHETDPANVAMEFDLGYAAIAGRKIPETLRQYSGRMPCWDIRDAFGIRNADANPALTVAQRQRYTYQVPVGLGEVDFKTAFADAETVGLKYFFVTQENSTTWGDSMAVARLSYQNLVKILT